MEKKSWARDEAVKIIHKALREGAYANIASKQGLESSDMSRVDKALVTEIVNGTLKNLIRIDWILAQFTQKNKGKIDPWIEDILRCGIYQILFLDRIPDSAVCNESAELARKRGHEGTVKFTNGVLRNVVRNKEAIRYPDKEKEPVKYLSVLYSHPEWMVKRWIKDFGVDFTEALLKANNETPTFTIRINRLKMDKEGLKKQFIEENIENTDGLYSEEALYIKGTSAIEEKESFKKGYYQVQDESSMLVAHVVDPKAGDLVIDVCSAPGGKTTHMAELMNNTGTIIARDIHDHKLKLIKQSCKRLGITNVKTEIFNAKELDNSIVGKADRVLVDAPCSGLGVLRRKPDLRWKKQPDNFDQLVNIQGEILDTASRYVKSGGVLIYSTCTINKKENNQVVEKFLSQNAHFYLEDLTPYIPSALHSEEAKKGYLALYPNTHKTDGFFIARLKRR